MERLRDNGDVETIERLRINDYLRDNLEVERQWNG